MSLQNQKNGMEIRENHIINRELNMYTEIVKTQEVYDIILLCKYDKNSFGIRVNERVYNFTRKQLMNMINQMDRLLTSFDNEEIGNA